MISLSPLQDKGLPQPSPLISINCLSIPGYSNQASYLISPSSSLSALPSFTIPWLPFCYSNSSSIISSSHNVSCSCPFFLLIVLKMFPTLVCSLIHDALFLSLHDMQDIFLFTLRFPFQGFHSIPSFWSIC